MTAFIDKTAGKKSKPEAPEKKVEKKEPANKGKLPPRYLYTKEDDLEIKPPKDASASLYQQIQRVAAEHPETRVHLVPLLRMADDEES